MTTSSCSAPWASCAAWCRRRRSTPCAWFRCAWSSSTGCTSSRTRRADDAPGARPGCSRPARPRGGRRPAPEPLRHLLPAGPGLGARGARLHAQHRARRAGLAPGGRARAGQLTEAGRADPAEPAGRRAAAPSRLRDRRALAAPPRRWAATSTTSWPSATSCSGFAIGDASGHGLPAALLVRDVVTGLRMGIEKDLKVAYVFGKLNRVIHRSNLSSRFVSVFYGELEAGGNLVYVNAGHPPPLLFSRRAASERAGHRRHRHRAAAGGALPPRASPTSSRGDVLVLCTDGILERRNREGEFFGQERAAGRGAGGPRRVRGGGAGASVRGRASRSARNATGKTTPRWS